MLKSQIEGENVEALKLFFNYLPEEIEKVIIKKNTKKKEKNKQSYQKQIYFSMKNLKVNFSRNKKNLKKF